MRVLVADDDEPNREVMADAIDLFGHEVVTVQSGQSVIDELSNGEFDLVLHQWNPSRTNAHTHVLFTFNCYAFQQSVRLSTCCRC